MASKTTKKFDIAGTVRHHFQSAKMALLNIPLWVWPLPFLLCVVILLIRQSPIGWMTEKPNQELIAPTVICLTAMLALFVHRWTRELFTLMLACLVWALFLRELHFIGTSRALYITVIALTIIASYKRDELAEFLSQRAIGILLPLALWTYFVSKLFDRHVFYFMPDYVLWHDNVEETLETCGHVITFALVIATLRYASTRIKKSPKSKKKIA